MCVCVCFVSSVHRFCFLLLFLFCQGFLFSYFLFLFAFVVSYYVAAFVDRTARFCCQSAVFECVARAMLAHVSVLFGFLFGFLLVLFFFFYFILFCLVFVFCVCSALLLLLLLLRIALLAQSCL